MNRFILGATLAALVAGGTQRAEAQNWISGAAMRNLNTGANVVRFEAGTGKLGVPMNYGFIDVSKDGYFGQAQFSQAVAKTEDGHATLTLGGEYEANSFGADAVYPQVGIDAQISRLTAQARFSPFRVGGKQQNQGSLFAYIPIGELTKPRIELSSWNDLNMPSGTAIGEIEVQAPLGKGWKANTIRAYGTEQKPQSYIGLKKAF